MVGMQPPFIVQGWPFSSRPVLLLTPELCGCQCAASCRVGGAVGGDGHAAGCRGRAFPASTACLPLAASPVPRPSAVASTCPSASASSQVTLIRRAGQCGAPTTALLPSSAAVTARDTVRRDADGACHVQRRHTLR